MKMWWILQEKLRHRLLQIKPYGIPQQEPLQPRIKLFWQEMIWKITQLPSRSRISVTTTQYQNLTANNLKTGRRWVYLDCFMVERKKEHYFQHRAHFGFSFAFILWALWLVQNSMRVSSSESDCTIVYPESVTNWNWLSLSIWIAKYTWKLEFGTVA